MSPDLRAADIASPWSEATQDELSRLASFSVLEIEDDHTDSNSTERYHSAWKQARGGNALCQQNFTVSEHV